DSQVAVGIKDEYERRGWIKEMENQVIAVGATDSGFSQWPGLNLFNIRFRLEDLHMFESYRLINDERIGKINRYELIYKSGEISVEIPVGIPMTFDPDTEKEVESDGEIESISYERKPGPVENLYLHKKIRNALKNYLIDEYGFCIGKECPTGQGTLVDLVREQNGNRIFYEIKAYNSIKSCIREALGQLLEYSFWPDCENAKAMIIIGIMPMTEESRSYLRKLRQKYRIPVYYQQFNIETNRLVGGDFSDRALSDL
ncbi:MAG: hypothetical protein DI539_31355, partial [Flavobacterium psychrophilum]